MNVKNWSVLPLNKAEATNIAEKYGVTYIIAMLLQVRGICTAGKINALLGEDDQMESPFVLKDMDKAVARIQRAVEAFEKIAIYGDYDADGITATAILFTYLESVGADVMYYIPEREGEGYGMHNEAIESLASDGITLIITVDNGISSVPEVEKAQELGIDVVITDHHQVQKTLPKAVAVIDPHRADCGSVFKDFSGAGIALKLVMALEWEIGEPIDTLYAYADLAAIGTIGDVVPLLGENRILVKHGLARIEESDREGIITLLNKASVTTFTATTLAFTLVPRINATGRMGSPNRAVELLITEYPDQAALLAEDICEDNERRKEIEKEITEEAITMIERDDTLKFSRILVLDGENWHGGVLGIVASKIVERFGKPTVIISRTGDEAKGSGRSVEGFSLFEAIRDCGAALLRFGGHPMAAGVTLCADKINEFRTKINAYAKIKADYMPAPSVTVECKLLPGALGVEIPQMLTVMEPFGSGNPYPVFGLFSMVLEGITPVGGGNHLRLNFRRDSVAVTCMKFGCRQENFPYKIGTPLDLAVILEAKEYKGAQNLTVMIKEMKPSGLSMDNCVRTYKSYEKYKRGEIMGTEELAVITPTRNDLADIYRLLRAEGGWKLGALQLLALLPKQDITLGKIMIALEILQERNLITFSGEELLYVSLIPATHKVDIFDSAVYKTLKSLTKE